MHGNKLLEVGKLEVGEPNKHALIETDIIEFPMF